MIFGSVCSGIETASLAFPSTWQAAWFAEVDPFCCALLKARYPDVPNQGDLLKLDLLPAVDLVIAGTPCQSFSVQGNKRGMDDPRGQLALRFSEWLGRNRPRWLVWENVAGVLQSADGSDFRVFLRRLAECGYGFAYRVFDAQYFGVPQRRRRVFVVGHYRDWRRPAAVLFDGTQHRAHEAPPEEVFERGQLSAPEAEPLVGWNGDETPKFGIEVCPTLRSQQGGEGVGIISGRTGRRLTVTEWERLQGIPDGYTKLEGWSDAQRRKAIGNAFCVHVIRWIANRIAFVDSADGRVLPRG